MPRFDKLLLLTAPLLLIFTGSAPARVSVLLDDFETTVMTPESTSGNNTATVLWQDLDLRWGGRNKSGDTADWQIVSGVDGMQLQGFDSDNQNTQCGAAFSVSFPAGENWALEFDAPLGANWNDIDIYLGTDDGDNTGSEKIVEAAKENGTMFPDTITGDWLHLINNGWDSEEGGNGTITYVVDEDNHVTIDFNAEGNLPDNLSAYNLLVVRLQMSAGWVGNLAFDNFALTYDPPFEVVLDRDGDDLTFTWDSQPGKIYDILKADDPAATPLTWSPWQFDIPTDPPTNVETYPKPPAEPTAFFKVAERDAPPPPPVFFDDFESAMDPDWTTGGMAGDPPGTAWERGMPTTPGDPPGAYSDDNCYSTNLDSNYSLNSAVWLRSPPLDLTDPGISEGSLTFYQFRDLESGFDYGYVRVLDAADESVQLGPDLFFQVSGLSASWEEMTVDLPAEAIGKSVKIEFLFTSDDQVSYTGWHIDDVTVRAQ